MGFGVVVELAGVARLGEFVGLCRRAPFDGAGMLQLGVELCSEEDGQVGEPQPDEEDDDARERAVPSAGSPALAGWLAGWRRWRRRDGVPPANGLAVDEYREGIQCPRYDDRSAAMADESGPEAGLKGVTEDIKGKAKEAVGAVTDNESLKAEGQAQQDKADAEREVAAREAEAEKARGQAAAAEAEERAHQ